MEGAFVSYLQVSTAKQGASGLGLEAQRKAVEDFLNGGQWKLISEHVEVESGADDERPKLAEALARCRLHNATLVIAKLDRLSRDAHFLLGLQKAGVRFVAADMPEANEMVVGIMAVIAQAERKMISARTKAALAAAKARGAQARRRSRQPSRSGGERASGRARGPPQGRSAAGRGPCSDRRGDRGRGRHVAARDCRVAQCVRHSGASWRTVGRGSGSGARVGVTRRWPSTEVHG